jgi:hypothetical protein
MIISNAPLSSFSTSSSVVNQACKSLNIKWVCDEELQDGKSIQKKDRKKERGRA